MKKIISIVLSVVMLLSLTAGLDFSAYAFDPTGQIGDDVTYSFDDTTGTLTISGTGETYNYDDTAYDESKHSPFQSSTEIDSVVVEEGVTKLGKYLFCYSSITKITLPVSLKTIGNYAFMNCKSLVSAELQEGLKSITYGAFLNCESLVDIQIPSTSYIDNYAFSHCSSIEELTIPDTAIIHCGAFHSCTSLKKINIPDTVCEIESDAFSECLSLEEIRIPKKCTKIRPSCFQGCGGLKKITVVSGNAKYDSRDNCNAIINTESNTIVRGCKNTKIPSGIKYIGSYAFDYSKGLEKITIPKGIITISDYAFSYCPDLKTVSLPKSLKYLKTGAFAFCKSMKTYKVNSKNKYFSAKNGILYNKKKTELAYYPVGKTVTTFTVPKKVKNIGDYAFSGSRNLKNVKLQKGLKSINIYAFSGCKKLESLKIPKGCKNVWSYALEDCKKLKELTFYKGTTFTQDTFGEYYDSETGKTRAFTYIEKINFKGTFKDLNTPTVYYDGGEGDGAGVPINEFFPEINIFCTNGLVQGEHKCYEKDAKVTKQPTFKSTGKKVYKCKDCKKKITVTLPKLGKAKLSKVTKGKRSFTAKWSKVANVGGYQIQYSTYKSMKNAKKVKIKGNKTFKKTVKNLKGGKKYFVRIRAYKKINGKTKYSAWSAKKSVKTKK